MASDILDEHRFKNQCALYETTHIQLPKDSIRRPTTSTSTATVLNTSSMSTTSNNNRHVKYSTQTNMSSSHSTTSSIHNRHSGSTDLLSIIRSFAMKPFKTTSMTNAIAGGQTSNVIGGTNASTKSSVNLLRYRPLSDVVTDHASSIQPSHAIEEFLRRMEWPVNSTTDEGRLKWYTAMKFLIPVKFDVNRAIDSCRKHEDLRKNENLDRIWINNPHLIQEIQSTKCFTLPQIPNQPLAVIYTVSNHNDHISNSSLTQQEQELITLQALICQLDVATESIEVQQNGLNFIYDMQNCSASQFDINLNKKILKLLPGGYPAKLKNIFIISAPKWFRVGYKVTLYSVEQMRDYLTREYGYSLDTIPITLGGTFDPNDSGTTRYHLCLSKVTNNQSICSPYYTLDKPPSPRKSTSNILYYNNNNHHHHNQEKLMNSSTTTSMSTPSSSLLALVSLRRHSESPFQIRLRKRESSSTMDNDKRRRSNENLTEEQESSSSPLINTSSSLIRKENNFDDQLKRRENSYRVYAGQQEKNDYEPRKSEIKRITISNSYRPLNEKEFLAQTPIEIRQQFRKIPNPPAKDPYAAKEEKNLDKSRYRDVIPGELTRVRLQPDLDDKNDFINANYVSGYNNQEKAYIFTQGPLQTTVKDFWRMIWQENISIIVMTTNIRESGMVKCFPYWPIKTKESLNTGLYQIQNESADEYDSFIVTKLLLKKKNQETRIIYHAHYLKWPDHGVPAGTKDALLFLEKVEYYKKLTMTKAPILLHCSAGIGRTGTFCAIDIGIRQYLNEKLIDIPTTVIKMRHERAGSVQTEDQYLFAHLALMDFIKQQQAIQEQMNQLEIDSNDGINRNSQRIKTLSNSSISSSNENNRSQTSSLE